MFKELFEYFKNEYSKGLVWVKIMVGFDLHNYFDSIPCIFSKVLIKAF